DHFQPPTLPPCTLSPPHPALSLLASSRTRSTLLVLTAPLAAGGAAPALVLVALPLLSPRSALGAAATAPAPASVPVAAPAAIQERRSGMAAGEARGDAGRVSAEGVAVGSSPRPERRGRCSGRRQLPGPGPGAGGGDAPLGPRPGLGAGGGATGTRRGAWRRRPEERKAGRDEEAAGGGGHRRCRSGEEGREGETILRV
ncbi:hypothetical protein BS78_01G204200, partial [Paspalum vaginatum]